MKFIGVILGCCSKKLLVFFTISRDPILALINNSLSANPLPPLLHFSFDTFVISVFRKPFDRLDHIKCKKSILHVRQIILFYSTFLLYVQIKT